MSFEDGYKFRYEKWPTAITGGNKSIEKGSFGAWLCKAGLFFLP